MHEVILTERNSSRRIALISKANIMNWGELER